MSAPKPRPSAWDVGCICCGRVEGATPLDETDTSWWSNSKRAAMRCTNPGCSNFEEMAFDVHGRELGARWGHEWAAVAWMAAAVEVGDDLLEASE